jgi:hypothetical protein
MSELDQCLYNKALHRFWVLRRGFKSLHRLKYFQYIVRIESSLKNNTQGYFKYADIKRNASGYPSSMFLRGDFARNSQSIVILFTGFFQSVNLWDGWIPENFYN